MARFIKVGAAQMGPVGRDESRSQVVARLLDLMREAKGQGCDLVVFTECALTPFFPRFWEEDVNAADRWFEREMPGPETQLLFSEAAKLGIGFHLGYAELAEAGGRFLHFNSSILVGPDGKLIGKYRKIHLPGQTQKDGENPHGSYEKRYFDAGNLGFRAWKAFGGAFGMCLGNDRRWPESYRVLALQGAEMILLGYNTASHHPDHPELDHLTNFHSTLSMQAGAYQNGCFVVGVAKAGNEDGVHQIGGSAIIAPSGEVLNQCTSLSDELIIHRCDLDQTRLYKDKIFNFREHRRIEAYALITETRDPISPLEPESLSEALPEAEAKTGEPRPEPIEKLFTEKYGYTQDKAKELEKRAAVARGLTEATEKDTVKAPAAKPAAERSPAEKARRELPADPVQAIEALFREEYGYSPEKIEPIGQAAARAMEHVKSQVADDADATQDEKPPQKKPVASEILAKARAGAKPEAKPITEVVPPSALPVAEDIGWLPGRFSDDAVGDPDRIVEVVLRLTRDYRYPDDAAKQIAVRADAAWRLMHGVEPVSEPPATAAYVPEEKPAQKPKIKKPRKPLTKDIGGERSTKTTPSLSGKEALETFTLFTEKYGYSPGTARGIAERAYSAWKRWQSQIAAQKAEPAEKTAPKPATTIANPSPTPVPEVMQEPEPAAEGAQPEFFVVHCPECEFPLKINQGNVSLLGRKARCPQCQTKFRLPESV